jgi:hypothetical protein
MKTLLLLCLHISLLGTLGCSDELSSNAPPSYKVDSNRPPSDQGDDAVGQPREPETDRIPSTTSNTTIESELGPIENPAEPSRPPAESSTPSMPENSSGTVPIIPSTGRSLALPIGAVNSSDSPMKLAATQMLLRFVPRSTISVDRVYFGFKLQGAECDNQGSSGSGAGNGGILSASIVTIDSLTGLPGSTIVSESVPACERFNEAYAELQNKALPEFAWINAKITLEANTLYGLIVRNSDKTPATHYFSLNMPIADANLAGPHAKNSLDPNAKGAILNMDPRELIAWSEDNGRNWKFGHENGPYLSYVNNIDKLHPATRVPQYGFRLSNGGNLAGQPYSASADRCIDCSVTYANAPIKLSLTQLGAFTSSTGDVGSLTITHATTAATASCTPAEGYGFRSCKLSAPFPIAKGESYTLRASGSVEILRFNSSQQSLFPEVGTIESDFRMFQSIPGTGTHAGDIPQIWAAPDLI